MEGWFGREEVEKWVFLKEYEIPKSQPAQVGESGEFLEEGGVIEKVGGVVVCGDWMGGPTVDGAVNSGIIAAEEGLRILEGMGVGKEEVVAS